MKRIHFEPRTKVLREMRAKRLAENATRFQSGGMANHAWFEQLRELELERLKERNRLAEQCRPYQQRANW